MAEKPQGCGCHEWSGGDDMPANAEHCDYPRVVGELEEAVGLLHSLVSAFDAQREYRDFQVGLQIETAREFLYNRKAFLERKARA